MLRGMKKLALVLMAICALALSGCSAQPKDAVVAECADGLQFAIEQTLDSPGEGWLGAEVETSNVVAKERDADHPVYEISGTAVVTLDGGRQIETQFECFGQVIDGKASASVNEVDGKCTPRARELGNDYCGN